MATINITAASARAELEHYRQQLMRGYKHLADLGDIGTGISSRQPIYEEGNMTLYRYSALTAVKNPVPVLIIYALVNRPYMADLQEGRSLIRKLLQSGLDIYLIEWGYPAQADRLQTLDDYINGYMDRCVEVVLERHKLTSINVLGICQGGVLSLCYAALHPQKLKTLITTVTPVDFHTDDDLLSKWVRYVNIEQLVDIYGNVPGDLMNWIFLSLKPYRLGIQKYLDLVEVMHDREKVRDFMRMEKWIFDSPDQSGEVFREFIVKFYQNNELIAGTAEIGSRKVDLGQVTMPLLNIYARDDHLVPPAAARALGSYVGSDDYTECEFPGGHIGIYVSGRAHALIPPTVVDWLAARA